MLNNMLVKKAFRIIRRNYGCPGLDGVSIKDIKQNYNYYINKIIDLYNSYTFGRYPVKTTTITDYNNKPRDIFIYCLYDRWIQQILKLQIEEIIENDLKEYVFGYRRKLNIGMLRKYTKSFNSKYILNIDILGFYNHINRDHLNKVLIKNTSISKEFLTRIDLSFSHLSNGLPQGNVLSPILSNYYLAGIDSMFNSKYARFSDDMFFAINDLEEQNDIINKLVPELGKLSLSINFEKVRLFETNSFK
ncbi:MAG: hypothetical protein ACD_22C00092G0013 [uncultured bacterium]|nr:MAG: hypothetical protein ACD_22C00092G0013 [uncultured bacterium]